MGMWLPNMHRLGPNISTSDITVSAATQANTRDLAKWHVDHAAHSQPVLVRLTVFRHGRGSLWMSKRTHNLYLMISRSPRQRWRAARVALRGQASSRSRPFRLLSAFSGVCFIRVIRD